MEEEPFYVRFRRIVFDELGLTAEQASVAMGVGVDVVRRLADGRTAQAKLDEALRLCDRYGVDPWLLAFGRPRSASGNFQQRGEATLESIEQLNRSVAEALAILSSAGLQDKNVAERLRRLLTDTQ